ncbi:MAG TPA: methyltransferase domain-containing protein, partial [Gemmatimonadaceae bacterium]|nr:methyltransferase domain-containing protein [Gemmatimonadaceae bacterium]
WGKRVLAALELAGTESVLDAGCGTGRLTALLAERLPHGQVVALDRSSNMTQMASSTLSPFREHAAVVLADLVALPFAEAFDVVFSTATFHWVLDHDRMFANLFGALKPGGRMHAQCGGGPNLARLHRRAVALARSAQFAPEFVGWSDPWNYSSAEDAHARLVRAGFTDVRAWLEEAPATFADADAFRVFIKTVVLRPFLAPISDERRRAAFVDHVVDAASQDDPPYTLDYWRLNITARRP